MDKIGMVEEIKPCGPTDYDMHQCPEKIHHEAPAGKWGPEDGKNA